ncbi:hypothetical protein BpHYR1_014504 [Brachionus plicatilis]|uniref:Uncharacterized protein n=1 Tax=Brachionus plicatilis TaxID=10195 RepID=A0A3M7QFR3_BRAPC|nr:hypothetical protein BpHYR1_014504 [Brachionus plicatilis]
MHNLKKNKLLKVNKNFRYRFLLDICNRYTCCAIKSKYTCQQETMKISRNTCIIDLLSKYEQRANRDIKMQFL